MKTILPSASTLRFGLLCALGLSSQMASADLFWFQQDQGLAGDSHPDAVAVDSSNNVVVTGSSMNASGNFDFYTAKYAAEDGRLLWNVFYDGPAGGEDRGTGVAIDHAGNVIVTGYSANGTNPNGNSPFQFYTAKYRAADGHLLWERRGTNSPGPALATKATMIKRVAVDSDGNVVVSGYSNGRVPCCERSFYTVQYDGIDGHTRWEQWYVGPGHNDWPVGLAVDSAGNAIVTGVSYNGLSSDHSSIQTIKYSPTGGVLWEHRYDSGTGGDDRPVGVTVDRDGNVFLSGLTVDSCCVSVPPTYYTAKYTADGAVAWEQLRSTPIDGATSRDFIVPQSIVVDGHGNVTVNQRTAAGLVNLVRYAPNGSNLWGQVFQVGGCLAADPSALAVDDTDHLIVTGHACLPNNCGAAQYVTARYAATGQLLWQQTFGSFSAYSMTDPFSSFTRGLGVDTSGHVVVAGQVLTPSNQLEYVTLKYVPSGTPSTTLQCPADIVTSASPGQCLVMMSFSPTATDTCGSAIPVTCAPPSGSPFPTGTTTVHCSTLDGAQCSFTVTVTESLPPTIACPANISVGCVIDALMPVNFSATATDNCDPHPILAYSQPPGSGFPVGSTTVTCTATDASGNQSSGSFTVTRAPLGFTGFLSPIGGADGSGGSFASPLRAFKLKSTIPVKFSASCDGSPVLTGVHTLQAIKYSNQTTSDSPIDATPTDGATTGNQFRLTGEEWHFNLDTKATSMSTGIWLLRATLSDGSQHSVWIQIK